MEVKKLSADEIRGMEKARRRELEGEIRRQIVETRMDIYSPAQSNAPKVTNLKRNLARLLTVRQEEALKAKAEVKK